jgi:hypothetical protein
MNTFLIFINFVLVFGLGIALAVLIDKTISNYLKRKSEENKNK